jgi:hypothetical protein
VLGDPHGPVIAWNVVGLKDNLFIFRMMDALKSLGWEVNAILNPCGLHICLTQNHIGKGQQFIDDVKKAIAMVKATPEKFHSSAGVYGNAIALPDSAPIDMFVGKFLHQITEQ